jgi:hypothetical protein
MIKEAKDEADERYLREEREMTDHITEKINWKKKEQKWIAIYIAVTFGIHDNRVQSTSSIKKIHNRQC